MSLGLYVHFPWCLSKCPYCDFVSYPIGADLEGCNFEHSSFEHSSFEEMANRYIDTLVTDFNNQLSNIEGRKIDTVFLGGGTPSLFDSAKLGRLLEAIRCSGYLAKDAEISIEINPGTIRDSDFTRYSESKYSEIGINRVSVGVQSFNDEILGKLGRRHNSRQAIESVNLIQNSGINNINIDIMFGLPGQDAKAALSDIEQAIDLNPKHISYYQLTIEPDTGFYHNPPLLPDEDTIFNIYEAGRSLLEDNGYGNYEISAYAKDGFRCKHNMNYWQYGDYLALGCSSHGKITGNNNGAIHLVKRYQYTSDPMEYMDNLTCESEIVSEEDIVKEFMLNASRLIGGWQIGLFEKQTKLPEVQVKSVLKHAQKKGYIEIKGDLVVPTKKGIIFMDSLLEELF